MAGKIVVEMSGEEQALLRSMRKVINEQKKTEAGYKKVGRESDRAGKQAEKGFGAQAVGKLKGYATGLFGISQMVGVVSKAYTDWRQEMVQLGKEHKAFIGDLVKDLAETGDLLQGKEIQRSLRAAPWATRGQAKAAFVGVSGGAPGATLERRLALAGEVSKQAVTGVDLSKLGELVGEMQKQAPGKTADDLLDIATKVRAQAGRHIAKVGGPSFVRSIAGLVQSKAATLEESLGLGVAALEAGLRPDLLLQAAGKIQDQMIPKDGTPAQKRFADAAPRERLKLLMEDEGVRREILGADQATRFGLISPGAARQKTREIVGAQRGDFASQNVRSLLGFPAGQEAITEQGISVFKEKQTRALGMEEAQAQRAVDLVRAATAQRNPWTRFMATGEARMEAAAGFSQMGGPTRAYAVLEHARAWGHISDQQARDFARNEAGVTRQIGLLEQQIDLQKEQNGLLRSMQAARPAPGPRRGAQLRERHTQME